MGCGGLLLGLIVGVIYALILFGLGNIPNAPPGLRSSATSVGLLALFAIPLLYAVGCFVSGLIYAVITNLALELSGGLELEFEG